MQFPAQAVGLTTGSTAAERTEKILTALDNAPVRPLSQITMAVDAGNGTTDRVQLSMRGASLNTTIDTSDPGLAQLMTSHTDDLSRALNKDGITLDSLRVRATGTGVEATSGVAAATAGQASQSSNDASSHSRFDRSDAWGQQQDQQEKQERQQSQSGGRSFSRQQQRRERGSEQ
jgi:preprotein translocase subunit SecD